MNEAKVRQTDQIRDVVTRGLGEMKLERETRRVLDTKRTGLRDGNWVVI